MFQKHAAFALAVMLLVTASAAAEEKSMCLPFAAQAGKANATNMAVVSTMRPLQPSYCHQSPTNSILAATQELSVPTAAGISAVSRTGSATQSILQPAGERFPSTGDDYTTHSPTMQEGMMMNFINMDRASNGLPPLAPDPQLCRIARVKSKDMLDNGYFAHESPSWGRVSDMLKRFGYEFRGAGENIARHATVEKAQAAFMSSPGHRRNILSPNWERVGVGIVTDANGYVYATQIFAR